MSTSWTRTFSPSWRKADPVTPLQLGTGDGTGDGKGDGTGASAGAGAQTNSDLTGVRQDELSPGANLGAASGVWHWLGRVPFAATADLQERLRAEIRAGSGRETLLLLEHDAVITLGRSADLGNVLHSEAALAAQGITLRRASRGGDVTFHGPGQLVGYPVIRLRGGVRAYVEKLAAALAEVLGELGVNARYRKEAPGLWVAAAVPGGEAKICAFGVNVHHRITMHGFALNLDPDLNAFRLIVPCGIAGCPVTSVRALRGTAPSAQELSARVAEALGAHLGVAFTRDGALPNCNVTQGH